MTNIFDKWNNEMDVEGLQKDIADAGKNTQQEYKEVPVGQYEVKIERMELKASKSGKPMVTIMFRILAGEFKNSCLFWNQIITQGFQIGQVNDFIRSLDVLDVVEFKDFNQYNNLIMDAMEAVDGSLEFLLDYSKTQKGFPVYKVKEVYEVA